MEPLLNEIILVAQQLWAEAKGLGLLGAALLFGIRIFRLPAVQAKVPAKIRWRRWPQLLKWAAPVVFAFAGTLAWKIGADLGWGAAVTFALTSAGASIITHKVTKQVGDVEGKAKLANDPTYQPGWIRKAARLVVPISKAVPK